MTMQSLDPGRNLTYVQFDTFRDSRCTYASVWRASVQGVLEGASIGDDPRHKFTMTRCLTQTLWFERYVRGVEARVGCDSRPDQAISIEVMIELMNRLRADVVQLNPGVLRRTLVKKGAYYVSCYTASLRGNEGFMMDATGLPRHIHEGRHDAQMGHVVIPLLGKYKGEMREWLHMTAVVNRTASGLEPRWWLEEVVRALSAQGKRNVPAMCNEQGELAAAIECQLTFVDYLRQIQEDRPDLIPADWDVAEMFGIGRSFRRGSDSRALNVEVPESVAED